ncbi:MAG: DUF1592 domain-containing protein [Verrucomicrobiia bacterium]
MNALTGWAGALALAITCLFSPSALSASSFETDVKPFLATYCLECHGGGKKVKGKVDFTKIKTQADLDAHFETWETAIELMREGEMPPDAAKQPNADDLAKIYGWYQKRFVESVEAHPGTFKPRRLSAHEYRNTLRSVLGFDLEVAIIEAEQTVIEKSLVLKLLPTDPPGKSGFKNDTSGNPLTTVIWDQYSYLADSALEELFSTKRRKELAVLAGPISDDGFSPANAEKLIRSFVPRALRRTAPEEKFAGMLSKLSPGKDLVAALKVELKTILMSPGFIYRGLLMNGAPGKIQPVDDFELAERLSYFLWADMPDAELFKLAAAKQLSQPAIFKGQVTRMLDSPRSRNLAEDFAVQWLSLTEIEQFRKRQFPFAEALKNQPIEFMDHLFREDRPLMELIDSKTTFINHHIAKFYPGDRRQMTAYKKPKGIEQQNVPVQRITLEQTEGRGGLLTMPGVVAMNKGPVLRGTWMLERILGEHLPDPPADVGQVPPNRRGEKLTFRQRFEQHRSNPTCAVCHDKIDPLGFALQAYDAEGTFIASADYKPSKKLKKNAKADDPRSVDTSGKLPSGETFGNFEELKQILMTTAKERIIRNIVKQTMSYALCRKLEIHDQPTVEKIVKELHETDGTWRDLIQQVVNSLPFRQTHVSGD